MYRPAVFNPDTPSASGWLIFHYDGTPHLVPSQDWVLHETVQCPCGMTRLKGERGSLFVHHALDGRAPHADVVPYLETREP